MNINSYSYYQKSIANYAIFQRNHISQNIHTLREETKKLVHYAFILRFPNNWDNLRVIYSDIRIKNNE